MKELSELIVDHPLFGGIPIEYTEELSSCAQQREFLEGSFLTQTGSSAETFYVILEGTVSLQVQPPHHSPITILTLGEGDTLGWSWIFPPFAWHFDALATSPTQVIAFDAQSVREKCETDHELGYRLMKRIAQVMLDRLVATRLQLLDLYR